MLQQIYHLMNYHTQFVLLVALAVAVANKGSVLAAAGLRNNYVADDCLSSYTSDDLALEV